ncbi:MAG: AIR synthase related protein [Pseudomonadota bacterium]
MSVLKPGKLPADMLRRLLAVGHTPPELLLPPMVGEDACAIAIQDGVLIAATDPITLTGQEIGGHAVVINANDVAVTGVRPRWFMATILLPPGSTEAAVEALFADMRQALERHRVALVGGHTEITSAVTQPVVVGQMLAFQANGHFIRTGGLSDGDIVLQIGPAPIEAAAVLANERGSSLKSLPVDVLMQARQAAEDPGISVVETALLAAALGASALHDPTEGGLSAGLHELADASGVALRVDRSAVLWFEPGKIACELLDGDPWGALASGTLLAGFAEAQVDQAEKALDAVGHLSARIGRAHPGCGVHDTAGTELVRYEQDEVSRILADPG